MRLRARLADGRRRGHDLDIQLRPLLIARARQRLGQVRLLFIQRVLARRRSERELGGTCGINTRQRRGDGLRGRDIVTSRGVQLSLLGRRDRRRRRRRLGLGYRPGFGLLDRSGLRV